MAELDPAIHVFEYSSMENEQPSQRTMRRATVLILPATFYLAALNLFLMEVAYPRSLYRNADTGDVIWLNLLAICFAVFLVVVPSVLGLLWLSAKWRKQPLW